MNTIKLEYHQEIAGKVEKKELEFSKNLLKNPYNINSLFVVQVDGKSMQTLINDKALVVADLSQKEFEDESIFLVYKDERMWIKKAKIIDEKEYFISINPDFSHLVYKKEETRVIAKALLTFTNL
jgi:phage repressor protein C with HTH and peptisase S24 domain